MAYEHTQHGWPIRIAFGVTAVAILAMPAFQPLDQPAPRAALVAGATAAVVLGLLWSRMTIRVDGDRLHWSFGPGWPRFSLPLAEIRSVEATRTTFWQGVGIHRTRRGWVYNVAAGDAVVVTRANGKQTLLGSDEPRRLKSAIDRAIEPGTRV
jgi:hypothetical protein